MKKFRKLFIVLLLAISVSVLTEFSGSAYGANKNTNPISNQYEQFNGSGKLLPLLKIQAEFTHS